MAKSIHSIEPGIEERKFVKEDTEPRNFPRGVVEASFGRLLNAGWINVNGGVCNVTEKGKKMKPIWDLVDSVIPTEGEVSFKEIHDALPHIPAALIKEVLDVFYGDSN